MYRLGICMSSLDQCLFRLVILCVAVQFSQHYLLRKLSFPSMYSWLLCSKLTDHICVGLFLAPYSVLLIYMSVFVLVPYCFNYDSFVIEFEIRECDASSVVLLSQVCFGYLGVFCGSTQI